mgnify:CR=1 FL=1
MNTHARPSRSTMVAKSMASLCVHFLMDLVSVFITCGRFTLCQSVSQLVEVNKRSIEAGSNLYVYYEYTANCKRRHLRAPTIIYIMQELV